MVGAVRRCKSGGWRKKDCAGHKEGFVVHWLIRCKSRGVRLRSAAIERVA
jgi:hypothetical protein